MPIEYRELGRGSLGENLAFLQKEAQRSFDLFEGPLFRVMLAKLPANTGFALTINIHHIVYDGWSAQVFNGELKEVRQGRLRPDLVKKP